MNVESSGLSLVEADVEVYTENAGGAVLSQDELALIGFKLHTFGCVHVNEPECAVKEAAAEPVSFHFFSIPFL